MEEGKDVGVGAQLSHKKVRAGVAPDEEVPALLFFQIFY